MAETKPPKETIELRGSVSVRSSASGTLTAHVPLPEVHPFYALVGRVVSEWAHLEHILDATIWQMTDPSQRQIPSCLTSQIMGVGQRCKAIIALCAQKNLDDAVQKLYRKLMTKHYAVAELRARFVHDPWYVDEDSGTVVQFRSMSYKSQKFGFHPISEDDFTTTIRHIRALQVSAMEAQKIISAALAT